ncbi:MAG: CDP-diacylglycerol--glycerol-3-phosphate 3-phosphatidyltransferase [bacterium]|nr:CDP-diacylglycerol--glycerol-3-phosphate 3-phosphatidyltransferase [bacterium]MDT8396597.1 CDP-diacylglycerol--glycerol-3-phosphate 3-phosphatidyltransferase [bacterium]
MKINTIPNWLTFGRIMFLPVIIVLTSFPSREFGIAAAVVFSVAAITDLLDGYIARKTDQVSEFGKLLDPIADKIIVAAAFIMLVHLDRAPAWLVALIISREFAVSGLRAYAGTRNVVIEAGFAGKTKTTLQVLAIIGLMVNYNLWGFPFHEAGIILLVAAFVTTMWSGYRYFMDYAAIIKEDPHSG